VQVRSRSVGLEDQKGFVVGGFELPARSVLRVGSVMSRQCNGVRVAVAGAGYSSGPSERERCVRSCRALGRLRRVAVRGELVLGKYKSLGGRRKDVRAKLASTTSHAAHANTLGDAGALVRSLGGFTRRSAVVLPWWWSTSLRATLPR
jgi:hypothetical protein